MFTQPPHVDNAQHDDYHLWVERVDVLCSEDRVDDEVGQGDCKEGKQRGQPHPALPHSCKPDTSISQSVGFH